MRFEGAHETKERLTREAAIAEIFSTLFELGADKPVLLMRLSKALAKLGLDLKTLAEARPLVAEKD